MGFFSLTIPVMHTCVKELFFGYFYFPPPKYRQAKLINNLLTGAKHRYFRLVFAEQVSLISCCQDEHVGLDILLFLYF